jgi:hypothetical protein
LSQEGTIVSSPGSTFSILASQEASAIVFAPRNRRALESHLLSALQYRRLTGIWTCGSGLGVFLSLEILRTPNENFFAMGKKLLSINERKTDSPLSERDDMAKILLMVQAPVVF